MNNSQKIFEEIEEVSEGWYRIPVVARPPKIQWGETFKSWPDQKKLDYALNLASAMNHAAATIQDERNALGELVEKKEKQIIQMQAMIEQNNRTLLDQLTKLNEYKNEATKTISKLNARIRELECGD